MASAGCPPGTAAPKKHRRRVPAPSGADALPLGEAVAHPVGLALTLTLREGGV